MHQWIADQNFNNDVLRGLIRVNPEIDIVRTQDLGFEEIADEDLLEFADRANRIVLTHDRKTMPRYARQRTAWGERMAGLVVVSGSISVKDAIEEILMIHVCLSPAEIENDILFVPIH